MNFITYPFGLLVILSFHTNTLAQNRFVPNYDESAIPAYELPSALVTTKGASITDASMWHKSRRPEVLELFKTQVYGRSPAACEIQYELVSEKR